jgi:hypothetical protein
VRVAAAGRRVLLVPLFWLPCKCLLLLSCVYVDAYEECASGAPTLRRWHYPDGLCQHVYGVQCTMLCVCIYILHDMLPALMSVVTKWNVMFSPPALVEH